MFELNLILKVLLKRPRRFPSTITNNPLNYFMIPLGLKNSISELSKNQRLDIQKNSVKKLRKVLRNIS